MKRKIITILLLTLSSMSFGQDYSKGFSYLEKGEFSQAVSFFQNEIEKGNENFTTRLCLGRAIGLSGNPQQANEIFTIMIDSFPDSYELKLNLAESFLWLKEYDNAKTLYQELLIHSPNNFAALLGYANTASSLKEYTVAYEYIQKALEIDPTNQSAYISKKYIMLGLAQSIKLNNHYKEAYEILVQADTLFPADIDITLSLYYHLIDMKMFKKSQTVLNNYVAKKGPNPRIFLAQSSLAIIQRDYSLAESLLVQAKRMIEPKDTNSEIFTNILIKEVNILIADKNYSIAEAKLLALNTRIKLSQYNNLLADLALAEEDYATIDSIIFTSSDELFKLKLLSRKAMQKGNYKAVKTYLDSINSIDEKNVFKHYFTKELNPNIYMSINPTYDILDDNGGNHAEERSVTLITSNIKSARLYFTYKHRETTQSAQQSASIKGIGAGLVYDIYNPITLQVGVNSSVSSLAETKTNFKNYDGSLRYTFEDKHNFTLFYNSQVYDYNTTLIESKISENRKGIKYYNGIFNSVGFYGEGALTRISDGNKSSFMFLSVFKNFKELPLLQLGVNYTYLAFDKQSDAYFSIKNYNMKEVFAKFDNRYVPGKKIYISLLAAFGSQKSNDKTENTQRFESELGFKFGKRSTLGIFVSYNNASSATIGGYQVTRMGIKSNLRL